MLARRAAGGLRRRAGVGARPRPPGGTPAARWVGARRWPRAAPRSPGSVEPWRGRGARPGRPPRASRCHASPRRSRSRPPCIDGGRSILAGPARRRERAPMIPRRRGPRSRSRRVGPPPDSAVTRSGEPPGRRARGSPSGEGPW